MGISFNAKLSFGNLVQTIEGITVRSKKTKVIDDFWCSRLTDDIENYKCQLKSLLIFLTMFRKHARLEVHPSVHGHLFLLHVGLRLVGGPHLLLVPFSKPQMGPRGHRCAESVVPLCIMGSSSHLYYCNPYHEECRR